MNAEATMTEEQMKERINLLSSEIDANEEENRVMQAEITALYQKLDAAKVCSDCGAVHAPGQNLLCTQ